jgi:hypothetical protein
MQRVNIVYGFVTRWARSKPKLDLDPKLPKDLKSRVVDNWRVLIAIADTFGPAWARIAREAATTFAHAYHDEDACVILLSDLRDIFNRTAADRMASVELIKLVGYDHGAGVAYNYACADVGNVSHLAVVEYVLPGCGYEKAMMPSPDWHTGSNWQLAFFTVPEVAEFAFRGRERELLTWFFWHGSCNPAPR